MEELFKEIKKFIQGILPDYLAEVESTDTPMPVPADKNIVFGGVDLAKFTSKVIVSVLPEAQEEEEEELGSYNTSSNFTITFMCGQADYGTLVRMMSRYATAFRQAVLEHSDLAGGVENAVIGTRTFYPNAGTADRQMTAVEVELTIYVDESIS